MISFFVCILEIINWIKNKNHRWKDEWKLTLLIYVNLKVDWVENLRRLKEIMRRDDILEMACWDCSCWWYESRNAPCSKFIPKHEKTFKNWNNRHLLEINIPMTKSLISIININVIKLILLFSFQAILYFTPGLSYVNLNFFYQFNQFHFVENFSP